MTQEQKQFIIKALQTGIPAIAQEHIDALEEVANIASARQEDLAGQEKFKFLDQEVYDVTVKTIRASAPFMANEYLSAYSTDVDVCQAKFARNMQARQEKETSGVEDAEEKEAPTAKKTKKSA